jgi:hypothetical protein
MFDLKIRDINTVIVFLDIIQHSVILFKAFWRLGSVFILRWVPTQLIQSVEIVPNCGHQHQHKVYKPGTAQTIW